MFAVREASLARWYHQRFLTLFLRVSYCPETLEASPSAIVYERLDVEEEPLGRWLCDTHSIMSLEMLVPTSLHSS